MRQNTCLCYNEDNLLTLVHNKTVEKIISFINRYSWDGGKIILILILDKFLD